MEINNTVKTIIDLTPNIDYAVENLRRQIFRVRAGLAISPFSLDQLKHRLDYALEVQRKRNGV